MFTPIVYALPFPNISPIFLSIGPLKIYWYGLGYFIGIIFAWWYAIRLLKRPLLWPENTPALKPEKIGDFVVWAVIGILIGGRLGNVLIWEPAYYWHHPSEIFARAGMAFHGGFLGLAIAIILFSRKNKINVWNMCDLIAAGAPIGIGLVRLCNFINSELWGRVTTMPFGVYFPNGGPLPRHPSQIYEAFMEGFLLFIILYFLIFSYNALKKPGFTAGAFMFFYGIARIIGEIFRNPDPAPEWFTNSLAHFGITYGMFLSYPLLLVGSIFMIKGYLKNKMTRNDA